MSVAVVIPAFNEERNIPYALKSVAGWADEVFVVDSESTDATRRIAESFGATVIVQPWLGSARQKNWAIDNLPFQSDWIFILDADEAVLPDLREEILAVSRRPVDDVSEAGFYINRYFVFLGKRIRHCGYYPSWNLRFFKRGHARYEDRAVNAHMVADGPTAYLKGDMEHYDRRGLEVYMAKHNVHSTNEARAIAQYMDQGHEDGIAAKPFGNALERRRWIKHHVYPRLPAKWLFRFLFMYVLRFGFLDGLTGLRFCMFISAYELLVALKIIEIRKQFSPAPPNAAAATDDGSTDTARDA
jgi:glycosyltransferase involved in cell wall biosynthesis